MSLEITVRRYERKDEVAWERLVLEESTNGTFLQSRNFLNYHPEGRFHDHSLVFLNGSEPIAVIPAHETIEGGKKVLLSHQGSTFGGLVVGKPFCKITYVEKILETLEAYCREQGFGEIVLKQTGPIFCRENTNLIDYYLFLNGYTDSKEIGYWIDFADYKEDIPENYTYSIRRHYRNAMKHHFSFRELGAKEVGLFYDVLLDNYRKFGRDPVHTLAELQDFKTNRLPEETSFYAVFSEEGEAIAGSMVFRFRKDVFHTQYLAVRQDWRDLFVNDFLYTGLIETARAEGFRALSFGTTTFEGGRVLNRPLAIVKEGFGTQPFLNTTYRRSFV